jgi:hypothetical protein
VAYEWNRNGGYWNSIRLLIGHVAATTIMFVSLFTIAWGLALCSSGDVAILEGHISMNVKVPSPWHDMPKIAPNDAAAFRARL